MQICKYASMQVSNQSVMDVDVGCWMWMFFSLDMPYAAICHACRPIDRWIDGLMPNNLCPSFPAISSKNFVGSSTTPVRRFVHTSCTEYSTSTWSIYKVRRWNRIYSVQYTYIEKNKWAFVSFRSYQSIGSTFHFRVFWIVPVPRIIGTLTFAWRDAVRPRWYR